MSEKNVTIGIDLGGSYIKGVVLDDDGTILQSMTRTTYDRGVDEGEEAGQGGAPTSSGEGADESGGDVSASWKSTIYDIVKALKEQSPKPVSAIGLAAPGIAGPDNDRIICMPERLQGLENFQWAPFLEEDPASVKVINDAQAALVAESFFGTGKGVSNIILLTLGTGVGGGVLINGELYQGHFQRAGHLGHLTLDSRGKRGITNMPGSLEDAIGNESLYDRSLGKYSSTMALVEAYQKGDTFATYVWLDSVRNLAIALCGMINAFAPEMVILGGGITKAGKALFEPLEEFMPLYEWRPGDVITPVRQAFFDENAGAVGAAGYAMRKSTN